MKTITNATDQQLVELFGSGNMAALEVLINRHRKKVYSYIFMQVRNQALAEDLFQETFIKVISSIKTDRYQDHGKFLSWVIRIAHNLIIDYYRKSKQLNTVSNDDFEGQLFNSRKFSDVTTEEIIIRDQIHNDVRSLIDYLPEDQKQVVLLRHYAGMSFKEIAEVTNVSINTALGRMRYALINLRKLINEKNIILTI
ncbi:MAG TPA: sigma-70 family RNA polymerase sigma factor [Bacteroidia bacterium]|nr:sigma-70 family RNA polymerase sigma factor [Bacteroidales bacterium]HQK36572.1 sigma-70 family RNA polymerase sigma factor [Bacteroidales bacterium]HRU69422.1 sigma-70 family RNA polymerase sigma factor [Bacteroidia bacterium]